MKEENENIGNENTIKKRTQIPLSKIEIIII